MTDQMQRLLDAAGWDAGSIRHKQLQDALDAAGLDLREKTDAPPSAVIGEERT